MEQFPEKNPNPVIIVEKDGTVLYSNEAVNLLLLEWGVEIGEKLPFSIADIVQKVITRNNPEKIEVKVEKKVYLIVFHPLPEQECVNISGFDISDQIKLEGELQESEAPEMPNLELSEIIDVQAIQSLMDDFYSLAHIPMGLIDLKGNILAAVAWQDICTKFHRIHPETCKNCIESDIKLSVGIPPGKFKFYRCKNNMWDVATPVTVGGKHVANIFSGQFFFEDEPVDYELFRSHARKYGFNEEEYIAALEKVPRLSREAVNKKMSFFMKLANILSQLSYSNCKLAKSLAERNNLVDKLEKNKEDLDRAQAVGNIGSWRLDVSKNELTWSDENHRIFGIPKGTPLTYETFLSIVYPDDREYVDRKWKMGLKGEAYDIEHRIVVDDKIKWVREKAYLEFDKDKKVIGGFGITQDITERRKAEHQLSNELARATGLYELYTRSSNLSDRELYDFALNQAVKITNSTIGFFHLVSEDEKEIILTTWNQEALRLCTAGNEGHYPIEKAGNWVDCVRLKRPVVYNDFPSSPNQKGLPAGHTAVKRFMSVPITENGKVRIIFGVGNKVDEYDDRDVMQLQLVANELHKIMKLRRIEKEVRESEAFLRDIMENVSDAIFVKDRESRMILANTAYYRLMGKSPEEVLNKTVADFHPPEIARKLAEDDKQVMETGKGTTLEGRIFTSHGWRVLQTVKAPYYDGQGNIIGLIGTARDITERKQEEHWIRRYNRILEGINQIFGNVVQAKTEEELGEACLSVALEITGSEFGFIIEMGADGLLHDVAKTELAWEQCRMYDKAGHLSLPRDYPVHGLYGSVIINEKSFFTNDPQSHPDSRGLPDGHPPIRSFLGVPLILDGKTIGSIAVANREGGYSYEQQEDLEAIAPAVTQALHRKKAEEAIRLSNLYNRSLIEASLDPLVTIGPDGKIMDVNYATEQVTGFSRKNLIGTDFSDYFTEPDKAHAGYQQVFTERKVRDYPLEIQHKDGHITPVLYNASVYKDENGEIVGVFAAARDITERNKAQEKIQTLANAVESSNDAILTKSLDGIITSWNNGAEKIYGYLAEEVMGENISIIEPGDIRGETEHLVEKIKKGERVWHYETLRMKKGGTIINVSVTLSPVFDASGELVAISAISRDITERKQMEEQTRQRAEEMETVMGVAPVAIFIGHDPKCQNITGNLMANELYEARLGENLSANTTNIRHLSHKGIELTANELPMQKATFKDIDVRNEEIDMLLPSGECKTILGSASPLHDAEGNVRGSVGAFIDITERKKAEAKLEETLENLENLVKERTAELDKAYNSLKESERSLSDAQEMAHIGNWERNFVTGKLYWSDEIYRIYGLKPQELEVNYGLFLSYLHPDDRDYVNNAIKEALSGKPFSIDHRIILANGEERIAHSKGETVFDKDNNPVRFKGTTQDITDFRIVEEKIKTLANIVESSQDAIGTLSLDGIITSWNKGAEQVYGYSAEEILGKHVSNLAPSHSGKETLKLIELIKQGKSVQQHETSRLRKDGKKIYVSITLSPVFDTKGKLSAVSFISRNITERKEAEEALRNFEIARKKELHHRIKNNLQVISSLLDLQAELFKGRKEILDSEVLKAFKQSMDRVLSIALIHEELYKGKNIDLLNFSQYIKELANNLLLTYRLKTDVDLNFDMEENIFLDMDTAIPLGIVINEIVSNSFKYAFSGRDKGEIRIKLHRNENRECKSSGCKSTNFILAVSDDGIGIPEDLNIEDLNSLGLQLVTSLIEQLDGELELKRDNGTEFNILFTVTEHNDKTSSPAGSN